PIELEGTFPLPEAQLDRFLLKLRLGYPAEEQEHEILLRFEQEDPLDKLEPVVSREEILSMQRECRLVEVEESVRQYLVRLTRATREHPSLELGASPRATLSLYRAGQALAVLRGRSFVIPDDVKALAVPVLAHRLILKPQARLRGRSAETIVEEILSSHPVPVEE
ncbi:MAG: MoxR family ATPase, partial [Chloroflexi bacterium]|nr:MoxR family ATPase [Chloroflexota bacterium]